MKKINQQPKNCKEARLKDVCELEYGKKTDQGEKNYLEIGDIDIENKSYNIINKEKGTVTGAIKVPKNTLLISTVRPTRGAITITKDEISVSGAFCRIKLKNKYLYYVLNQDKFFKYLGFCSTGSTYPTCKDENILDYKFLYAENTEEQKKIAEILGSVDENIEKTEQIILKTEELKKGLMQKFFSEKGKVKREKLGQISNITSSKRILRSEYVKNGIPFYRSKEIIEKVKGKKHDVIYYISLERFLEFKEKFGVPQIGDILITAVGTIGVIYLVDEKKFYFKDGNLIWLKNISNLIDKLYLKYYLNSEIFQRQILENSIGSSQKALTIEKLEKINLPILNLQEQKKIAEILSAVDDKIDIYKQIKNKLTELKKGLMQDLLSGKVRVN